MARFPGLTKFITDVSKTAEDRIMSGKPIMRGNETINLVDDPARYTKAAYKEAIKSGADQRMIAQNEARAKAGKEALWKEGENGGFSNTQRVKSMFYNSQGKLSKKRVAGVAGAGYMGVSSVGRIATGGGLYRDSDGNFDIIGVPIV